MMVQEKKKWGFRLSAKSLFLTYSRCPEHWTKEFVRKKTDRRDTSMEKRK